MNDREFNEWVTKFFRAFPSSKAWLNALDSKDDREGVQEAWRDALQDVELRDAKAVIERMTLGDDPPPPSFDRELTGSHVRALAKANAARRNERGSRSSKQTSERHTRPAGPSAGELYQQMMQTLDAHPELTAREVAEQVMPAASENPYGKRYDCSTCLDSGIVMVWSDVSIQAAIRGELDQPAKRKTCGAPCSCRAGDHYVWRNSGDPPKGWTGWLNTDVVYSVERYCVCPGNDTDSPIAIESFKDWVADRQLAAVNSKREPSFADWNAGGKENAVAD